MEKLNEILKNKDEQYIENSLSKMYNSDMKRLFLEEHLDLDGTRKGYITYLSMISDWEILIDKDCYNFNITDVKGMFANQMTSYPSVLRFLFTVATKYTDWAGTRQSIQNGTNIFTAIDFGKDILPFINQNKMNTKYLSDDDMQFIISQIDSIAVPNYQDLGVLVSLFYGIKGSQFVELRTLRADNIDIANSEITVICKIDGNENPLETRKVQLPLEIIQILLKADQEIIYATGASNRTLAKSPYIFRNGQNRRSQTNMISYMVIRKRVLNVLSSLGYYNTGANDVYMSGKIAILNKMKKKENREMTFEDFQIVNAIFNDDINNYNNLKLVYNMLDKAENK